MSDVQSELAEKLRRLAEMRQARLQRWGDAAAGGAGQRTTSSTATTAAAAAPAAPPAAGTTALTARERLAQMRADREARAAGGGEASPTAARTASQSPGGSAPATEPAGSPPPRAGAGIVASADLLSRVSGVTASDVHRIQRAQRAPLKLVRPDRLQWDVVPQGKADCYAKQCQTEAPEGDQSPGSPLGAGSPKRDYRRLVVGGAQPGQGEQSPGSPEQAPQKPPDEDAVDDLPEPQGLTEADKERIMAGDGYRRFFKDASFLVMRALTDFDLLPPGQSDAGETIRVGGSGEAILRRLTLSDKLTRASPVTSVDFNNSACGNPELFLASYYKRTVTLDKGREDDVLADVEGQVLIWSMKVPQKHYQHLRAPCDVARAVYNKHNGNLVLGSMYNGQVCIWDTRKGPAPVQLTPLTMDSHTHPVFGMEVVGTANSHHLATLSTDGRFCTWSLDKLSTPVESMMLSQNLDLGVSVSKEIQATSLGFRDMDASKYFVGSDNGVLFAGNRSAPATSPESLEGHTSPITSLHCHPVNPGSGGHDDFADFVLTSSMDWTCKLWHPAKCNKPIFSFDEYTDFVYDVKWSPEHPAVFASVDGAGMLSVYHLGESMETPYAKAQVSPDGRPRACSHLSWTADGRFIAVGDAAGDMSIWQASQRVAEPQPQDYRKLGQRLGTLHG
eukprot:TRINITY_DN4270_c0_g2_i2.p1 TRINITY_DN4270_c0_g2~~TRINITY_DN4270_c0_g2_i2.p1  ORF type:complete len:725 (+),score=196.38 TRINITY_DN4270_c0_g2_i2:155-2176(+)